MIVVFVVLLVALVGLIGYLVAARRGGNPVGPAIHGNRTKAAPAPIDDEEATQVKVAGPRIVRIAGNIKVGDEMSIVRELTVGRGDKASVRIQDPELAELHARFSMVDKVPVVADLGVSSTFVNDRKVVPSSVTALKQGDLVRMGQTVFMFLSQK